MKYDGDDVELSDITGKVWKYLEHTKAANSNSNLRIVSEEQEVQ